MQWLHIQLQQYNLLCMLLAVEGPMDMALKGRHSCHKEFRPMDLLLLRTSIHS